MDTVQIRIRGLNKFHVATWALFNQDFHPRKFAELSRNELTQARNPRVPYLRHFVLHGGDGELFRPKVEIFESANVEKGLTEYDLVITFSIPQLLNENSLQEIAPSDSYRVFDTLRERLSNLGISTLTEHIKNGTVSVAHFCKNIILPPEIRFRSVSAELSKTDMGKAYDTSEEIMQRGTNNNEIVRIRCGTREWICYNKIEDLKNHKGKGAGRRRTQLEKDLFAVYALDGLEVFRYEYRLNKAQTIKSEINSILGRPYPTPIVFNDLFTEGLWKTVLLNSWEKLIMRPENQLALLGGDDKLALLHHILHKAESKERSAHSQNQALVSYSLAVAIKDHGVKTIRQELARGWSNKADDRLTEKLEAAASAMEDLSFSDGLSFIDRELRRFNSTTLDSFPKKMALDKSKRTL
ncbi:MAG: hypothetical protein HY220_03795 [Candidatus Sungbacteria bacterium]|uniref:Uncharacterized protein n=1 Tax=Candidatus Sungiibacteriota bacterium TaxID=2750080 RepID=A0A9D6QSA7_9BACT|nr:hypothetical protein [Candidatus Sungbacteria bacterium]